MSRLMVSFLTIAFIYLVEEEMQLQNEIDVLSEQIESSDRKPTNDTISLSFPNITSTGI